MLFIGYFLAVLIGVSLGLIGGGGSILTVPILVYVFHVSPHLATSYSLFIVGGTASVGAYKHYTLGNLKVKSGFLFAIPSLLALLFVRKEILPIIPAHLFSIASIEVSKDMLVMLVFAMLMIVASFSMIAAKKTSHAAIHSSNTRLIIVGLVVGSITGFLGAGGGFLIIPALIFFAGLSMKQSIGTSLLIISFNSLLGFVGDVMNGVSIDYTLLLTIATIAIAGIFIGTQLSKKIDGNKLKPAFGWFVLVMGVYIIIKETWLKK